MENAVDEPIMPLLSPEDLFILQAQAAGSVTLQEALNAALLEIRTLRNERDAAVAREAVVAVSLHETTLNLEDKTQQNAALLQSEDELNERLLLVTTQRDAAVNHEVESKRSFEESHLSLEARTRENASLVVLNQIITNEKDAALKEMIPPFKSLWKFGFQGDTNPEAQKLVQRIKCQIEYT